MKALYLESQGNLSVRDYAEEKTLGDDDVEIAIKKVGICGSDIHYYTHGRIGSYIVDKPMVLGHEAAGVVTRTGRSVTDLKVGDRVCMEPGIPDFKSKATLRGFYNLDPKLTFWATPPIHGCLRESVIHPASLTFKLPDAVSLEEGAMIEPLAIGMQVAMKAAFKPGDVALVFGAGTIGIMCAISAMAGGCSKVIITDIVDKKLDVARKFDGLIPVNSKTTDLLEFVAEQTGGWGADVVIEASGADKLYPGILDYCCLAGRVVIAGIPNGPVPIDVSEMLKREVNITAINRYCNVYERAIGLVASGKINIKQLIGRTFPFTESIAAYQYVERGGEGEVKVQISFD